MLGASRSPIVEPDPKALAIVGFFEYARLAGRWYRSSS
jgi:hypothetical protein